MGCLISKKLPLPENDCVSNKAIKCSLIIGELISQCLDAARSFIGSYLSIYRAGNKVSGGVTVLARIALAWSSFDWDKIFNLDTLNSS